MEEYKKVRFWSYLDVFFWSIMVGAGESYISAFALSYGFSERYSGLLSVVPLGIASLLQIFSPRIFFWIKSRKLVVILCSLIQAACLFSLVVQPERKGSAGEGLMLILTAYWFFALSAGPPWNAWIVSLLPGKKINGFFATRGVIHQVVLLLALGGAGLLLSKTNGALSTFTLIFIIAGVARLFSVISLANHPAEKGSLGYSSPLNFQDFCNWLKRKNVFGMILFIGLFRFGVAIGSPYFTPFVLKKLNLSYALYMLVIVAPFVSRAVAYHFNERIVGYLGIQKQIVLSLILVGSLPLVWTLEPDFWLLILIQLVSGLGWAGFEYALLLRQIEDFEKVERSRILSWANFIIGISTLVGVVIGSQILGRAPSVTSYKSIFYLSSLIRISPLLFIFMIDWKSSRTYTKKLFFRIVGIRATSGAEVRPILYTKKDESSGEDK